VRQLERNYKVEVSKKSLSTVARASLALAKLFDKYALDAIAIQDLDDEMHRLLKTRPSLYVPSIFEKGKVVGMEGDIHTTIAMIILSRLTGQPVLFAEAYSFDTIENTMLMGHTTMLDIRVSRSVSEIRIIPDCEYQGFDEVEGAYMYFIGKEGVVTMLSLVDEIENYRLVVAKGVSLPLKEPKTDGYSHILVRPTVNVKEFFKHVGEAGVGQHWAVTYGDHVSLLKKFAELMGLNITVID
jgi:L-arabinose isomerase